ncbi:MAG TPA: imidazolonepropionase [bacterium]|nr:imidazolonepropionase [bacterium]
MRLLVTHIGRLATMAGVAAKDGIGVTEADLGVVDDAALLVEDETISFAGPARELPADLRPDRCVDAGGAVAVPGLIDPHTHPCWVGSRHDEFAMRAAGKTYLEISAAGGGIRASTRQARQATLEQLIAATEKHLARMFALGMTTVEAKSGYALNVEGELRLLRAIQQAARHAPQTIVPTFMGAHAIPAEFGDDAEAYTNLVIHEMLPAVAAEKLAEFCDVFVEDGFFSVDQGRRILLAAKKLGLKPKLHADEFMPLGGAQLAAEVGAVSADHLMAIDDEGIRALAAAGVTATLLPATTLFLGQTTYAPARRLLDAGCRVALSTDFNPGSSHTENLLLVFTLACTQLRMTVAEALAAITYNAARAVDRHKQAGALLPGRRADVVFFDVKDFAAIPYHLAMSDVKWIVAGGVPHQAPAPIARRY